MILRTQGLCCYRHVQDLKRIVVRGKICNEMMGICKAPFPAPIYFFLQFFLLSERQSADSGIQMSKALPVFIVFHLLQEGQPEN